MTQAAENAILQLPAGAQVLVNWDLINADLMRYLNGPYLQVNVPGLNATTLKQIQPIIQDWLLSGEPLSALEARFEPLFGSVRAARIASTEVTKIVASANLIAWGSSGLVSGKRWFTVRSDDVCLLCRPLHGKIVELSANFTQTAAEIASTPLMRELVGDDVIRAYQTAERLIKNAGASVIAPPRHVGCRCFIGPIVGLDLVSAQLDLALGLFGIDNLMRRFDNAGVSLTAEFFAKAGRPELLDSLVKG
jgi:hypothetical protein